MLHIINKSSFQHDALASCLRLAQAKDALLLLEDGVYAATSKVHLPSENINIYALQADVAARGLSHRLLPNITLIDYAGFVDLTVKYAKIQTWL